MAFNLCLIGYMTGYKSPFLVTEGLQWWSMSKHRHMHTNTNKDKHQGHLAQCGVYGSHTNTITMEPKTSL